MMYVSSFFFFLFLSGLILPLMIFFFDGFFFCFVFRLVGWLVGWLVGSLVRGGVSMYSTGR